MKELQDGLTKLQTLYSFSKKISMINSAKRATTERTILLEKLLEKILLHDHSILLLLGVIPEHIQELDVSLIASAARNIMETANLYFHLSQKGLDREDLDLRVDTMVLNEIYNEIDITGKFGFSPDSFHAQIKRWFYKSAAERFQKYPHFTQLPPNEQAQIVSGWKPAFKMESPHILQERMESAVYNLLSNSVHSLPLGLSSNSVNRFPLFQNFFRAEELLVIAIHVSCLYTAHVVKNYLNLRKHLSALLSLEEKKILISDLSAADLETYIHALGEAYENTPFDEDKRNST